MKTKRRSVFTSQRPILTSGKNSNTIRWAHLTPIKAQCQKRILLSAKKSLSIVWNTLPRFVKDDLEKTIMREERWDFDACLKCSDREGEHCKECNKGRVMDSGWWEKWLIPMPLKTIIWGIWYNCFTKTQNTLI
ncbi:MAG: hypothetical protein Ta2E_12590 [Mycoplasmoidaceae bacterium]|nr:MAG: hypothetical protein Ta2E_12590 [Mycoplasmoidaceae bacterium]